MDLLFKTALTAISTGMWLIAMRWIWTHQLDPISTLTHAAKKTLAGPEWIATRDSSKIYQGRIAVGDVAGSVTISNEEITFARLINTTSLNIDQPFEYQRYTLQAKRVETSSGVLADPRGMLTAVLDGVHCEVVK